MKLKTITKVGAVATVAFGLVSAAQAAYIVGNIGFNGQTQFSGINTPSNVLISTTGISTVTGATVTAADGTFLPTVGASVAFNVPWLYGGTPALLVPGTSYTATNVPISDFWTIDYNGGGNDFSFQLTGATIVYSLAGPGLVPTLNIYGVGTVTGSGYQASSGTWNFSTQQPAVGGIGVSQFTWSSSGTSVPDGGTTVALLGFSLLGLHGVRRKFAKR